MASKFFEFFKEPPCQPVIEDKAKHKFANAVIINAVGKNFLTSEPSAKTPFTNFPIP